MALACLAVAHGVGVLERVPQDVRLERSLGAAMAGLALGWGAGVLLLRRTFVSAGKEATEKAVVPEASTSGGERR